MKICLSEFTYKAFEELLIENFKQHEFILIDSEANVIQGEGKPDIALVSYELMFKALKSEVFFKKYLALIDGCSYVQGSWAGIETPQAQALIRSFKGVFAWGRVTCHTHRNLYICSDIKVYKINRRPYSTPKGKKLETNDVSWRTNGYDYRNYWFWRNRPGGGEVG